MGAVFEVLHIETQRRRALKVMLPELLDNRQLRERFQMEARITANVESEYIVDVFDAGIDDATGMPFLVMELLNGEDLAKVVERAGRLSAEHVVSYLRQVASALDKTHAAGIVHRDLKPENLFLTHREDGTPRVKILDFGISKVVTEAATGANATRGLGTPLYMAPEQVLAQTISPATDLYALGLIAYTLLVGFAYWHNEAETFDNPISFVVHTSKGATDSAVRRAAQVGHSLPAEFDAWFQRATHLDTGSRFRSASALVSALAESLGVAQLTHPGASLGPDATGAQLRVAHVGHVAPSAETMIARTAPGTEFDRKSTLSGGSGPRKTVLWLSLAGAALVGTALLGAFALRARPPLDPPSTEISSGAAHAAIDSAAPKLDSASAVSVIPAASASGAIVPPPATAAESATPATKATSHAKSPSTPSKLSPSKPAVLSAHKVSAPKYTRD
jgi:serine/threonine-protein kinase